MKKQLLPFLIGTLVLGSFTSVLADESQSSSVDSDGARSMVTNSVKHTASGVISSQREALQKKAQETREKNLELHKESKENLKDFRLTNSGTIGDMRKSNTGATRDAVKKAHDERVNYIKSLSGLTLEQKAQYLSGAEDRIRTEIETRFQNASGSLLAKRMEVYVENAARRAEALMNQLALRTERGSVRSSEIDALIAKVTAELPNLTTEKKTKLAKKIDEKIVKIQKNKRLPEVSKTEIVAKLTALRAELLK